MFHTHKSSKETAFAMSAKGCERETHISYTPYFDFCADIQHTSGYDAQSNHGMYHSVQRKEIFLNFFFTAND